MSPFLSPSNRFASITNFFFFFFLICSLSTARSDVYERHKICSREFSCANRQGLGYPFWTRNRTLDQPEYCGHPDFELICSGEFPQIRISSLDYKILDITPNSHTLKLARTDYTNNLCPTTPKKTTFSQTLFRFPLRTHLVTLYYGCPRLEIKNNSDGFVGNFNCEEDGGNRIGYYVTRDIASPLLSSMQSFLSFVAEECRTNATVPVIESERSKVELEKTQESLKDAIDEGFGLIWDANNSACSDCELSGGACGYNNGGLDKFICYCTDGAYELTCNSSKKVSFGNKKSNPKLIGIAIASAVAAVALLAGVCFLIYLRRKRNVGGYVKSSDLSIHPSSQGGMTGLAFIVLVTIGLIRCQKAKKAEKNVWNSQKVEDLLAHKRYSYIQVRKMTKSFTQIIGRGGFGIVYKGKLHDGRLVAVKVLTESKSNAEEFINEVASMSKTSHVNIVSLLGFCFERSNRAIIYEFVPNGSLDKFISNKESSQLDMKTIYDIALGVARGLEYMHNGCNTRIVHFDIKPQNILLDEDLCPKIADFGLAKLHEKRQSMISLLDARGTFGYIAPEVFSRNFGRPSHKSDVYSFGMLLLEIVGARTNDAGKPSGSDCSSAYFPDWIYKNLEAREIARLAEDEINGETDEIERKMILVGLWCIQSNPLDRPPMSKVVEMMEGSIETLQIPPKPLLFYPTASIEQCPLPAEDSSFSRN